MESQLTLLLAAQSPEQLQKGGKSAPSAEQESGKQSSFLPALMQTLLSGAQQGQESGEGGKLFERAELTVETASAALEFMQNLLGELDSGFLNKGQGEGGFLHQARLSPEQQQQFSQLLQKLEQQPARLLLSQATALSTELASELREGARELRQRAQAAQGDAAKAGTEAGGVGPEGRNAAARAAELLGQQAEKLFKFAEQTQQRARQLPSGEITKRQLQTVRKALKQGIIRNIKHQVVRELPVADKQAVQSLEQLQRRLTARPEFSVDSSEPKDGNKPRPGPARQRGNLMVNEQAVKNQQKSTTESGLLARPSSNESSGAIKRGLTGYQPTVNAQRSGGTGATTAQLMGEQFSGGNNSGNPGSGGAATGNAAQSLPGDAAGTRGVQHIRPGNIGEMVLREYSRLAQSKQRPATQQLQLQLQPPELGKMRATLTLEESGMNVRLEVENSRAKQALQSQLPSLRQTLSLQENGRVQVELTQQRESEGGFQQSGGDGREGDGDREQSGRRGQERFDRPGGTGEFDGESQSEGNLFDDPEGRYF